MTYTLERATPDHIVGRLVGSGDAFIAIAEKRIRAAHYVLAVQHDGRQYVTWCSVPHDGAVDMFWGHYYRVADYENAHEAFRAASNSLDERAS